MWAQGLGLALGAVLCAAGAAGGAVAGREAEASAAAAEEAAAEQLAGDDACDAEGGVEGGGGPCGLALRQLRARRREAAGCRTAVEGDNCWTEIQWALKEGLAAHPDWYPGLTASSSTLDVQQDIFSKTHGYKCPKPCGVEGAPPSLRSAPPYEMAGTTATEVPDGTQVRILHISDTHNMHETIEEKFPLPAADVLIHSGDFTNFGKDEEFDDANNWLATLRPRYKHILAVTGNHDWISKEDLPRETTVDNATFWNKRISNARLLLSEEVNVLGLRIFGSSWKAGQSHAKPRGFGPIPSGLDILVTHAPAFKVLDWCGDREWGSSAELRETIVEVKPKVHLFGHDHEQRGVWAKAADGASFIGGVEYEVTPGSGKPFPSEGPPPADYPAQIISNNAMMNHPGHEGWTDPVIAGQGRLIIATRVAGAWQFHAEGSPALKRAPQAVLETDAGIS